MHSYSCCPGEHNPRRLGVWLCQCRAALSEATSPASRQLLHPHLFGRVAPAIPAGRELRLETYPCGTTPVIAKCRIGHIDCLGMRFSSVSGMKVEKMMVNEEAP